MAVDLVPMPRFDGVYWKGLENMNKGNFIVEGEDMIVEDEDVWADYNLLVRDEVIVLENIKTFQLSLENIRVQKDAAFKRAMAEFYRRHSPP